LPPLSAYRREESERGSEEKLPKAPMMDGVDLAKLTSTLKVCHQDHRALKDEGDGSQFHFRTAAEAHDHLERTINGLVATVKRLPPRPSKRSAGRKKKKLRRISPMRQCSSRQLKGSPNRTSRLSPGLPSAAAVL
jgi:hypothetical protein